MGKLTVSFLSVIFLVLFALSGCSNSPASSSSGGGEGGGGGTASSNKAITAFSFYKSCRNRSCDRSVAYYCNNGSVWNDSYRAYPDNNLHWHEYKPCIGY